MKSVFKILSVFLVAVRLAENYPTGEKVTVMATRNSRIPPLIKDQTNIFPNISSDTDDNGEKAYDRKNGTFTATDQGFYIMVVNFEGHCPANSSVKVGVFKNGKNDNTNTAPTWIRFNFNPKLPELKIGEVDDVYEMPAFTWLMPGDKINVKVLTDYKADLCEFSSGFFFIQRDT